MKSRMIVLCALFFGSCSDTGIDSFKKTASGLEYKIIESDSKGPKAGSGATIKLHCTWYRGDTIWQSTFGKPLYQPLIPGMIFPYDPFESLVYGIKEHDSVIVRLSVDSLIRQHRLDSLPPGTKKEDFWTVGIRILKVFPFDPLKGDSIIYADKIMEKKRYDSLQTVEGVSK